MTKRLDASEQMSHVGDVRQAVRFAVSDLKQEHQRTSQQQQAEGGTEPLQLPGFCLPKGIQPILPIFRESILNGPPELKEQAAIGLGEVIDVTSAAALKPSVVHITGPLIRILGDRFAFGVKVSFLGQTVQYHKAVRYPNFLAESIHESICQKYRDTRVDTRYAKTGGGGGYNY